MLKSLAVAVSLVTTTLASAQSLEPVRVFDTKLYCYTITDAMNLSIVYGEQPLFTGIATVDSTDDAGEPTQLQGPMLFLVNQDTGTWAHYIFSPTGSVCTIALGGAFEPYVD